MMTIETNTSEMFYRVNDAGNAVILHAEGGHVITKIDASVYPIGSDVSARYEHPAGIVLSISDAESIGIVAE